MQDSNNQNQGETKTHKPKEFKSTVLKINKKQDQLHSKPGVKSGAP